MNRNANVLPISIGPANSPIPEESWTEWVPEAREVQTTVAPRPAATVAGAGPEGRSRAFTGAMTARVTVLPDPTLPVNHTLPSGPPVMPEGATKVRARGYSVMTPCVVILATWFPTPSVNHKA